MGARKYITALITQHVFALIVSLICFSSFLISWFSLQARHNFSVAIVTDGLTLSPTPLYAHIFYASWMFIFQVLDLSGWIYVLYYIIDTLIKQVTPYLFYKGTLYASMIFAHVRTYVCIMCAVFVCSFIVCLFVSFLLSYSLYQSFLFQYCVFVLPCELMCCVCLVVIQIAVAIIVEETSRDRQINIHLHIYVHTYIPYMRVFVSTNIMMLSYIQTNGEREITQDFVHVFLFIMLTFRVTFQVETQVFLTA
eukprot:TRINITY_DN6893_c3_g1_i2.p3 TRINITY_DN6893_c3_g1~~TRINITY_DN6893_c3_g1_i2.p3  ORF type:complete len:251 (-),score=-12.66 TRINITY_DN6893_c3_g1_i2:93-845(-)